MKTNKLPQITDIESITLENGLNIYIKQTDKAPTANIQLWVKTGSIHEGNFTGYGLSHFLEHMVFQGTAQFSSSQIMQEVTSTGGDINAYTSFEQTVYYINTLSSSVTTAVDILLQLCAAPIFPENAFNNEKDIILRERAMSLDNADRILGEKLWLEIFKSHPARHPIIGYSDNIQSVNRDMMLDYFHKRYAMNRMFFVITGDVNPMELIEYITEKTINLPSGNYSEVFVPKENNQCVQRFGHTYFDDPVPRIALGFKIPGYSDETFAALKLLAAILGNAKTSRLVQKLRDTEQIALDIDAFSYPFSDHGVFAITACCETNLRKRLYQSIVKEIESVRQNLSEDEIVRAKKHELLRCSEKLRSNSRIANAIGNSVFYFNSPDSALGLIGKTMTLTKEDISNVAEKYLNQLQSSYTEIIPPKTMPLKRLLNNNKKKKQDSPKPIMETLPKSNLRMIHIHDKSLPVIDISIIMPGGVFFENVSNAGITRMCANLLTSGTGSFSEKELAELMDDNAVMISATGGNNTLSIKMKFPTDSLKIATKLISSIINEPLFEDDKLNRERNITIETIKSRKMNPQRMAEDTLNQIMYDNHPYANPSIGSIKSATAMTREEISTFYHSTCLNPAKTIIGFSGDISQRDAKKFAKALYPELHQNHNYANFNVTKPLFPKKNSLKKIQLPKEQAVVYLGVPGASNISEDRYALDIIQIALNGMDSRLFNKIREDEGLAYYTGVYLSRGLHDGIIAFYAGTNQKNYEKVISLFQKEKKKLIKTGLTEKEFANALIRAKCIQADSEANTALIMSSSVLSEYYGNGYMEPWEQLKILSSISRSEVNGILKKYLNNKETIIVAGSI